MIRYSKDHEWISIEGDVGTVGISNHAQAQLGDVVFVDPPSPGRTVAAHEVVAVVESVKAASDVYSPVSGEIMAMNENLAGMPALVNEEAEGKGWFFKIKLSNTAELDALMDKAAYEKFCASA